MKYTVIHKNFVRLGNILLFCGISYKLIWNHVYFRGKTQVVVQNIALQEIHGSCLSE